MPVRSSLIVYTFSLYILISAAFLLLLDANGLAEATNIKWTPNSNPDAPEAATAPRSQKYWDENNIERPDYAKTDFEVMKEKLQKATGRTDGGNAAVDGSDEKTNFVSLGLIVVFFIVLWIAILRIGMGSGLGVMGIGKRQGVNRLGGGHSASLGNRTTSNGTPFGRWGGNTPGPEEKARMARLARFETKKDS